MYNSDVQPHVQHDVQKNIAIRTIVCTDFMNIRTFFNRSCTIWCTFGVQKKGTPKSTARCRGARERLYISPELSK